MKRDVLAAVFVIIMMVSAPARAEVVFTNDVVFFEVQGKTPAELYKSILSHSMQIDGKRTVASITTKLTQSGKALEHGNSCRADKYKINLDFVIKRPQIADEDALSPEDRKNWEQMYAFIRSHEELHRQIWLSCAHAMSDEVAAIEEATCRELTKRTNLLWSQMISDCDRKQRSFDDEQTKMLLGQQFYIDALRGSSTQ